MKICKEIKKSFPIEKLLRIVIIIFVLALAYTIFYFAVLPKVNKSKLTGEWSGSGHAYRFTQDGKFTAEWSDGDSTVLSEGSYVIRGNTLVLYSITLNIDLLHAVDLEFIRRWIIEGSYNTIWRYKLKFSKDMLYMDGVNINDFPRLSRKAE